MPAGTAGTASHCVGRYMNMFVCYDYLRPSLQFYSHIGTGWTSTKQMIKCLAQGLTAVPPARLEPSISSQALYYWATAILYIWTCPNSRLLLQLLVVVYTTTTTTTNTSLTTTSRGDRGKMIHFLKNIFSCFYEWIYPIAFKCIIHYQVLATIWEKETQA